MTEYFSWRFIFLCYQYNIGVDKDDNKSIEWYEKLAKQGYKNTECSLGYLYENVK